MRGSFKRRTINGVELWVKFSGSYRYIGLRREMDGEPIYQFSGAPFVGKLRDLYAHFQAVAEKIDRVNLDRERPDIEALRPLTRILARTSPTAFTITRSCDVFPESVDASP